MAEINGITQHFQPLAAKFQKLEHGDRAAAGADGNASQSLQIAEGNVTQLIPSL